jgi:hypothetical protein
MNYITILEDVLHTGLLLLLLLLCIHIQGIKLN